MARSDARPPQIQVPEHKHNFRLPAGEVASASIDPPARLPLHGMHVGCWRLVMTGGKTLTLHFETLADMQLALAILPRVLSDRLHVRVWWDARKGCYAGLPSRTK
ncbi:MAG: hypothetical protein ONB48_06800 [candidate division KSB1 bacterium]|nr:hypothetical protein [candidate division KSB1 bacterium]MDZ7273250.1 hypothetical protein [candidate division KSB1 bacterium]MDZ7285352.1 hypothetical protein [candidate division KSB1 bacterium]MDZ7298384.1 hypothetical protein [candidate division KSB1 bacterium]MDZ7306462.1 hypothetical protein [candidate division KSB1 bacterium]